MNNFDYRYMVYNTRKKEFQFMRICEKTRQGAEKIFYNLIGTDSLKYRFEIRKVTKKEAEKIREANKLKGLEKKIKELLPNIEIYEIEEIVKENKKRGIEKCKKKEIYLN